MYKIQFCIVQFDTRAFWEIFIEMSNIRRCGASWLDRSRVEIERERASLFLSIKSFSILTIPNPV